MIPGIFFHLAGVAVGLVLGAALGLIRDDRRRGYHRPADPFWVGVGISVGLTVGVALHYLGLTWRLGLGLGIAFGFCLGAVVGTLRAARRNQEQRENSDLAKRFRE